MGLERVMNVKNQEAMDTVPVQVVTCICNFLEYFLRSKNSLASEKKECERKLSYYFGFAYIWSFGCSFKTSAMKYV